MYCTGSVSYTTIRGQVSSERYIRNNVHSRTHSHSLWISVDRAKLLHIHIGRLCSACLLEVVPVRAQLALGPHALDVTAAPPMAVTAEGSGAVRSVALRAALEQLASPEMEALTLS
jgi:hypothetical protein